MSRHMWGFWGISLKKCCAVKRNEVNVARPTGAEVENEPAQAFLYKYPWRGKQSKVGESPVPYLKGQLCV